MLDRVMDTSKYNFRKIKESNDDGIFHQEFIDEDKHVKYNRVTWDSSMMSKDESDMVLSALFDTLEVARKVLPNIVKSEIGENYYEVLTFSDDDVEFTSNKLLPKIIKNAIESSDASNKYPGTISYFREVTKAIRSLPDIPEYVDAIKEIYRNYIDKEL